MIEKYNKIKTPEELLSFMNKYIKYGIYGTNDKIYEGNNPNFQYACQNYYVLSNKDRLLKYSYGHCWDQVELERDWFKNHNYEFKTFFIWFRFNEENNYFTHTYLVYKYNDKYYYFEHSDEINRGIYEFNSYKEAIIYQMNKHIEMNKNVGNKINEEILSHIEIYEYEISKYGINQEEFYDNLFNSKLIYDNNEFEED